MWVVDRQLKGVRTLSNDEVALITAYVESQVAGIDVERSSSLLRRIRADKHWLTCGCSHPAPVMHIALLDTGRLVVRNNRDGPEHAQGCEFARQIASNATPDSSKGQVVARQQPDDVIRLHAEFTSGDSGKGATRAGSSKSSAPAKKRLLSLLLSLMDMAGLNRYDPANPQNVGLQFKAMRDAAETLTVHPGIPLSRFFDSRIRKDRLFFMAKRLRESNDFGTSRRVGLMLDVIAGTSGRTIHLGQDEEISFFGSVERSLPIQNPSLALATVATQQPGSKFYELAQLATVPVVSRRVMFPVGKDESPQDVAKVLDLLDWLQGKGVRVVAVRYLFTNEGGSLIELRHAQKIVTLNLAEGQPQGDYDDEDAIPQLVLERANYRDMDTMKRHIAKVFLNQRENAR